MLGRAASRFLVFSLLLFYEGQESVLARLEEMQMCMYHRNYLGEVMVKIVGSGSFKIFGFLFAKRFAYLEKNEYILMNFWFCYGQTLCLFSQKIYFQESKNTSPLPPPPLSTASPVLALTYKPEVNDLRL